ncbi:alpha-galactosidase [Burkholderia sp. MSMB1835]|uniref:alpha-galactosidase n=1 Tax=Burkholderia sp. MSMB1835 TaxID=1637876 RepID=UPI000ABD64CC|nr:alpha-galactosidase [Burkholderia sp. MSMB1835]
MNLKNKLGILTVGMLLAAGVISGCGGDDTSPASVSSSVAMAGVGAGGTDTTATSDDGATTDAAPAARKQIAVNPPPMGWSSWNSLAEDVSFDTIKAQADGLAKLNERIASGNKYQYVNIDEGWWTSRKRDANGNFIINVDMNGNPTNQWPGGMKAMADYIHGKGLKAGIYIDSGPQGCGSTNGVHFVGSDYAHYDHDFLQFAQWGYDFVKVDWCGGSAAGYDPQQAYTAISQAIQKAYAATGKLLVLNMCDWGTLGKSGYPDAGLGPWAWGAGIATSWRTTGDIYGPGSGVPKFGSVLGNFNGNYHPEGQHTGYYNDPDMMVAGMGMTAANDLAHVNLWAIAGAPMILGNDLSKPLSSDSVTLLTNPELIAIDQDALGLQGLKVADANGQQIWAKLLAGSGRRAVLLLNNGATASPMTVTWKQLGLAAGTRATVRDVWAHKNLGTAADAYTVASVPAGGTVMLVLRGKDAPSSTFLPSTLSGGAAYAHCIACASGRKVTGLGTVTFSNVASSTVGGFVQIAYLNAGPETAKAQLGVNGGNPTTVAFPPAGKSVGTVTVYVGLKSGLNTLTLSSLDGATPAPEIASVAVVAGPVKLPPPPPLAYEAEAAGNTLGGAARVASCNGCSGGQDVGYIGNGDGTSNGTLTINGINVAASGTYSVSVSYANGDGAPRNAQISFDGATPVTVSFPSTGGWGNVSTLTVTGTFQQGSANTLRFSNPTGWAPDIDGIAAPVKQ